MAGRRLLVLAAALALAAIGAALAETGGGAPRGAGANQADWLRGRPAAPSTAWRIAYGGRLYDNWAATLGTAPPTRTHPLYPRAGAKRGAATWRCKECHGWDTNGAAGAYAKGSHRTGIKGLRAMRGAEPGRIARIVRGPRHGYGPALTPDRELMLLALFVARGQIATERHVDYRTGKARGDKRRGKAFFQTVCAACHGFDGRALNFKTERDPEFIGTVARKAPWELMHKLRHGQPGAVMPAFGVLPAALLADVIAYAQTLPAR